MNFLILIQFIRHCTLSFLLILLNFIYNERIEQIQISFLSKFIHFLLVMEKLCTWFIFFISHFSHFLIILFIVKFLMHYYFIEIQDLCQSFRCFSYRHKPILTPSYSEWKMLIKLLWLFHHKYSFFLDNLWLRLLLKRLLFWKDYILSHLFKLFTFIFILKNGILKQLQGTKYLKISFCLEIEILILYSIHITFSFMSIRCIYKVLF